MTTTLSIGEIFSHAWYLLRRNPIIIVPGVVIGAVVGVVGGFYLAPAPPNAAPATGSITTHFVYAFLDMALAAFGYIVTSAYTTGMAGAAWERGEISLADGRRAFARDWTHVATAALYMLVLEFAASLIALPTLFLSFPVVTMLLFYVFPSAVVGERRGWDAIRESFRIATQRYLTTIAVVLLLIIAGFLAATIAGLLRVGSPVGSIIASVVQQGMIGFSSLVAVGEYLNFRELVVPPVRR